MEDTYGDLFKIHEEIDEEFCPICGGQLGSDWAKGSYYCGFCSYEEFTYSNEKECPICGSVDVTKYDASSYFCERCTAIFGKDYERSKEMYCPVCNNKMEDSMNDNCYICTECGVVYSVNDKGGLVCQNQ